MGMTFANFILFGNTPVFIIWFIIRVRSLMIDGAIHLSKVVDIPSIPTLLLFVKLFITIELMFIWNNNNNNTVIILESRYTGTSRARPIHRPQRVLK